MSNKLSAILTQHNIPQAEFARGIGRSRALVSRLISGEVDASRTTIDAVLSFLSSRLRRSVTYEEAFGKPSKAKASTLEKARA